MPQPSAHPPADPRKTPVRRKPPLDFSLTGLVYCAMMMFMGLAAINSQANLLFGVFGLMIGILLISGVVSRKVLRRLDVRRTLPDHAVVGRPTTISYQVRNRKRYWPSLSVSIAELDAAEGFTRQPQAYMLHVAPQMTASVPTEVIPKRRGLHQFDRFQVSTSFPFGFIRRAVNDRQADRLLVYPTIGEVDRQVFTLCVAAERSGATMRPRRGGSDEFYGVKEFRPGDNPRWIYWRRSARTASTGLLVSKELTQVAPPRLLLLVDTYATPQERTRERLTRIERSIAMAASLADEALAQDLLVGLFVWSNGWQGIEPSSGKRHRNDLLSVLARLPANTENSATDLVSSAGRFLKSGTTAVLLTPDDRPGGISEGGRNPLLTIPAGSPSATAWFQFPAGVDFSNCMPWDQQAAASRARKPDPGAPKQPVVQPAPVA
jgi:uncharacterized protein (DUF58 family)